MMCHTSHTCQKTTDLVHPPLDTQHNHAGDGQVDVRAPVLEAFSGPACVVKQSLDKLLGQLINSSDFHF